MEVLILLGVIVLAIWFSTTEAGQKMAADKEKRDAAKRAKELQRRPGNTVHQPISSVGVRSESAGLACPKCGGTNFKAKRSAGAKVAGATFGVVGALAMPKRRVKCVTCGTEFLRG